MSAYTVCVYLLITYGPDRPLKGNDNNVNRSNLIYIHTYFVRVLLRRYNRLLSKTL